MRCAQSSCSRATHSPRRSSAAGGNGVLTSARPWRLNQLPTYAESCASAVPSPVTTTPTSSPAWADVSHPNVIASASTARISHHPRRYSHAAPARAHGDLLRAIVSFAQRSRSALHHRGGPRTELPPVFGRAPRELGGESAATCRLKSPRDRATLAPVAGYGRPSRRVADRFSHLPVRGARGPGRGRYGLGLPRRAHRSEAPSLIPISEPTRLLSRSY